MIQLRFYKVVMAMLSLIITTLLVGKDKRNLSIAHDLLDEAEDLTEKINKYLHEYGDTYTKEVRHDEGKSYRQG